MKRLNFQMTDALYNRILRAKAEGHYMKVSELIRAGITRELDKLGI